jgi:hypothetical protein
MRQFIAGRVLAAAALATVLAACSTNSVIDSLPAAIGEPTAAPVRPVADTYQYPAVHDMPPPRPDQLMTDEQEVKMEQDLANIRDRQEKQLGVNSGKKDAKTAKKKPQTGDESQTTGDKANP